LVGAAGIPTAPLRRGDLLATPTDVFEIGDGESDKNPQSATKVVDIGEGAN